MRVKKKKPPKGGLTDAQFIAKYEADSIDLAEKIKTIIEKGKEWK